MAFSQSEARARNRVLREQGLKLCPRADCPSGGVPQPFSAFFRKASTLDGYSSRCKVCHTRETSTNRVEYLQTEHGRAVVQAQYDRRVSSGKMAEAKERHRLSGKMAATAKIYNRSQAGKIAHARTKANNLVKVRARAAVNNAVQEGKILPASAYPCTGCRGRAIDYHHHLGYEPSHWLDVLPYCKRCHEATHHQQAGTTPDSQALPPAAQSGE